MPTMRHIRPVDDVIHFFCKASRWPGDEFFWEASDANRHFDTPSFWKKSAVFIRICAVDP